MKKGLTSETLVEHARKSLEDGFIGDPEHKKEQTDIYLPLILAAVGAPIVSLAKRVDELEEEIRGLKSRMMLGI